MIKGYKDTGIQGYKDSRIQEYRNTRIQGYKDPWMEGYIYAEIKGTCILYTYTSIQDTRVQGYIIMDTSIFDKKYNFIGFFTSSFCFLIS